MIIEREDLVSTSSDEIIGLIALEENESSQKGIKK